MPRAALRCAARRLWLSSLHLQPSHCLQLPQTIAESPKGPATQEAPRRVHTAFLSPLFFSPDVVSISFKIQGHLNVFLSATAISALTQVSPGWGFSAVLAVHTQLFYHVSASSQKANECFACLDFICFTKLPWRAMAASYFVSQSPGTDYFNSELKSEIVRTE